MQNIKFITFNDDNYPENLKKIDDSPTVLFYKGNINLLNKKSIAIVGSRNSSKYGEFCALKFSYELSKKI